MGAGAVIVNTSSEQPANPSPEIMHYAMTRAAVLNFTKGLAKELAPRGIRVNAVAPGPFWTPLQVSGGRDGREAAHVRRRLADGTRGAAGRDRGPLRGSRRSAPQLLHGADLRFDRR